MNQIEKALSDYLGDMCGMRLKPHALTGLAKAAIAAMQPAPPQKQEGTDMNQIEKVARAIEGVRIFARFNDWTSDHVPGYPIEICRWVGEFDQDCEIIARYPGRTENDGLAHLEMHLNEERAKAAIAAMPVQAEPVAWMYERKPEEWPPSGPVVQRTRWRMDDPARPFWIEHALYAHPPVPQEVIAWRYARTDGFVILVSKRYTDQHPAGDGWTEQALGVIPTPMDGGSDEVR